MSDLHLGHPHTLAQFIINNLGTVICDTPEFAKLDLLILAGDVFDRLLNLPQSDVRAIKLWIRFVLWLCMKHGVALRVLEGTPRHDRKQSQIFEEIRQFCGFELDFRYVQGMEIEWHAGLEKHILYIPDEYRHDCRETEEELREMMALMRLEKVDIAVMHGLFDFQLAEIARTRNPGIFFNTEYFLSIVQHYVFIGHDHKFCQNDRIVIHGSYDRTGHGYETPKGCVRATIAGPDERYLTFVENKGAKVYRTINVEGWEEDQVTKLIEDLALYPEDSHFKFVGEPTDYAVRNVREIRKHLRTMHIDTEKPKSKEAAQTSGFIATAAGGYIPPRFGPSNVKGLLMDWISKKNPSPALLQSCGKLIDGYVAKSNQ